MSLQDHEYDEIQLLRVLGTLSLAEDWKCLTEYQRSEVQQARIHVSNVFLEEDNAA